MLCKTILRSGSICCSPCCQILTVGCVRVCVCVHMYLTKPKMEAACVRSQMYFDLWPMNVNIRRGETRDDARFIVSPLSYIPKNTSQVLWLLASINMICMKCNGYSLHSDLYSIGVICTWFAFPWVCSNIHLFLCSPISMLTCISAHQ